MPTVDFFQNNLVEESQLLTSFLSPFAAYCYCTLLFGITSGPEFYQEKINRITGGMENTTGIIDAICVYSVDIESREMYLFKVLQKLQLQEARVTLNMDKCEFMQPKISFVGHEIGAEGICADHRNLSSVSSMKSQLHHFLGMSNQLGKFFKQIS